MEAIRISMSDLGSLRMKLDGKRVVYVGKGKGCAWGNKYVIGRDGTRDEVVRKYIRWLRANRWFVKKMRRELREAEYVVCWCKDERCHGDVMKLVLEAGGVRDGLFNLIEKHLMNHFKDGLRDYWNAKFMETGAVA